MEQPDDAESLRQIASAVRQAKSEFEEAEKLLKTFYHDAD